MENEEKPAAEQKPTPIMDVVAPPFRKEPDVVEEPKENFEADDESDEPEQDKPSAAKEAPAPTLPPKPKSDSTVPVAPIVIAVVFFLVLSGLAFYAYTKTN